MGLQIAAVEYQASGSGWLPLVQAEIRLIELYARDAPVVYEFAVNTQAPRTVITHGAYAALAEQIIFGSQGKNQIPPASIKELPKDPVDPELLQGPPIQLSFGLAGSTLKSRLRSVAVWPLKTQNICVLGQDSLDALGMVYCGNAGRRNRAPRAVLCPCDMVPRELFR